RRHTRSKRDWSSDVCSSDLQPLAGRHPAGEERLLAERGERVVDEDPDVALRERRGDRRLVRRGGGDATLHERRDGQRRAELDHLDRKSTRLNSTHVSISYAV